MQYEKTNLTQICTIMLQFCDLHPIILCCTELFVVVSKGYIGLWLILLKVGFRGLLCFCMINCLGKACYGLVIILPS